MSRLSQPGNHRWTLQVAMIEDVEEIRDTAKETQGQRMRMLGQGRTKYQENTIVAKKTLFYAKVTSSASWTKSSLNERR